MRNSMFTVAIICICMTMSIAQDIKDDSKKKIDKKETLSLSLKDGLKPDVYIDGKKYDSDIVELLDQSLISSIDVIKGKKAIEKYSAPNGAIIIKTKRNTDKNDFTINIKPGDRNIKIEQTSKESLDPLIIIDGKISDKETLSKFSPDNIESIEILKGEAAEKKYKAKYGAVVVKTKKGE